MKILWRCALVFLGLVLLLGVTLFLAFKAGNGEWSHHVRLGSWQYPLAMAPTLRLLTRPEVIHVLHGQEWESRWGRLQWQELAPGQLQLQCSPCRLHMPALSETPLEFPAVTLRLTRKDDVLSGKLRFSSRVAFGFIAPFDEKGMQLQVDMPATEIAAVYALFGMAIPELARARIDGRIKLDARLELPGYRFSLRPELNDFRVSGLGTEILRSRLPQVQCPHAAVALSAPAGRWLPRAVIAAEDQRFYQHPGYDQRELIASLQRNQSGAAIARGGSTLDQQLAKLLFTGGERSHVRKLRELLYAVEMEETLGKPRILQIYLAVAPWGKGVCGAENAALVYYGKPALALNRAEAAWLAAMLHTPDREFQRWKNRGQPDVKRGAWVVNAMGGSKKTRQHDVLMLAALAPPADSSAGY